MKSLLYINKILFFGILLCIIPLGLYIYKFGSPDLSIDKDDWGVFGDYIGGTLNPLIGLINLILLIQIAKYVSEYDDKHQTNSFLYNAYNDLYLRFEKINQSDFSSGDLESLGKYINIFAANSKFLFSPNEIIFEEMSNRIAQSIQRLLQEKKEEERQIRTGKIKQIPISEDLADSLGTAIQNGDLNSFKSNPSGLTLAYNNYQNQKANFLQFIQFVLANKDIKDFQLVDPIV